jgi:hypothetical protein
LSRAASTASGELLGTPSFSASRATSGTAISQNVVMPSRPPRSADAALMPWGHPSGPAAKAAGRGAGERVMAFMNRGLSSNALADGGVQWHAYMQTQKHAQEPIIRARSRV